MPFSPSTLASPTNLNYTLPNATKSPATTTTLNTPTTKTTPAIKAFQILLVRDWLSRCDNDAFALLQSILHLRERCWTLSKAQHRYLSYDSLVIKTTASPLETFWKEDDAHLCLSYALYQHERSMTMLRTCMADWSQIQDLLGHRYEAIVISAMKNDSSNYRSVQDQDCTVKERCRQVYAATALELYRKQKMVQELLENVDDLLYSGDEDDDDNKFKLRSVQSCRVVAQQCVDTWSRKHESSCLYPYSELLNSWQAQYQPSL